MKVFGKFLLWVAAYAMGAALIFALARRPAPPVEAPEPAAAVEAPAETSSAGEPPAPEEAAPREEEVAPPAAAPDATLKPSFPPRRVKAVRIPSR